MTVQEDRRAEFEEEHKLLQRYRDGDPTAYAALFEKHWRPSLGYAHRIAGTRGDPEELAQEAFTRVMETIGRGKGPTVSMGHYLRTTIRSIAAAHARKTTSREVLSDSETLAALFEAKAFNDDSSMAEWLVEGFNRLSSRQQYVVWEHSVEGRSLVSIAPEVGLAYATAVRTYHRAMSQLRTSFVEVSAEASANAECSIFVASLLADTPTDDALENHLLTCTRCRAVRHRLGARNDVLMSVILVAGLGELGLNASKGAAGTVVGGWFTALAIPAKIAVVVVPVVVIIVGTVVLAQQAQPSAETREAPVVVELSLGGGQGSSAFAELDGCQVIRDPASGTREFWRLAGGTACQMRVEAVGTSPSDVPVVLLDTGVTPSRRDIEITTPGRYTVILTSATGADPVTTAVEVVQP